MRPTLGIAIALLVTSGVSAAWAADGDVSEQTSYSFIRTLDGQATLASVGRGPGEAATVQQPLMQGDRIQVAAGARLEIALADRNLLRVGGESSLVLARVAFSADRDDRTTLLDLQAGEIVLQVTDQALGDQLPEISTPVGSIYIHEPGTYRIQVQPDGSCEVAVRSGFAELLTERGSTVVRSGEDALALPDHWSSVELAAAGPLDGLERWGAELDEGARLASSRTLHVEPYLAYQAAPLARYGNWVDVDATWYWQPRVATGWRPYWQGNWTWTPSGMTWVSDEPWGWVPYHYGTWSNLPGYGWVWRPGNVYSPAWVYWYWSSSWTGWCPVGYYTDFYRPYWPTGFRLGVYGWTGGDWGLYAQWNFLPTPRLCDRHGHGWRRTGVELGREGHGPGPHGILTTDTHGLPRNRWDRPDELVEVLARRNRGRDGGGPLPTVTDFVARRPGLPPVVRQAVEPDPNRRMGRRVATPLDPAAPRLGGAETGRTRVAEDPAAGWRRRAPRVGGLGEPGTGARALAPATGTDRPGAGSGRLWGSRVGGALGTAGVDSAHRAPGEAPRTLRRDALPTFTPRTSAPPAPPSNTRQGWKLRGGWGEPVGDTRATGNPGWRTSNGDQTPVSRVIGGLRRTQPDAPPAFDGSQGNRRSGTPLVGPGQRYVAPSPAAPGSAWIRPRPGTQAPAGHALRPTPSWRGPTVQPPSLRGGSSRSTPPPRSGSSAPPPRVNRGSGGSSHSNSGGHSNNGHSGGHGRGSGAHPHGHS